MVTVFLPQCPFHGPVIPRDEKGRPVIKSSSSLPSSPTPYLSSVSEPGLIATGSADGGLWPLDPELQEAIRDAKGAELLQTKKKQKGTVHSFSDDWYLIPEEV